MIAMVFQEEVEKMNAVELTEQSKAMTTMALSEQAELTKAKKASGVRSVS